jgi:hypothetical protein
MARPEANLYQIIKKNSAGILFDRIENWAVPGVPDLLGYNQNKTFFTLELKATKGNKIALSPHQVSWHLRHGSGSFILVHRSPKRGTSATCCKNATSGGLARGRAHPKKNQGSGFVGGLRAGGPTHFYLYKGSQIIDLVQHGLKTKPVVGGLHISEIVRFLNGLGA